MYLNYKYFVCQVVFIAKYITELSDSLQDQMELLEFFPKCLEEACSIRPVVLMLDSLDQLPADEGGRRLDWLPAKIPDDFYLIMSTLPGAEYECLPHLKVKGKQVLFSIVAIVQILLL